MQGGFPHKRPLTISNIGTENVETSKRGAEVASGAGHVAVVSPRARGHFLDNVLLSRRGLTPPSQPLVFSPRHQHATQGRDADAPRGETPTCHPAARPDAGHAMATRRETPTKTPPRAPRGARRTPPRRDADTPLRGETPTHHPRHGLRFESTVSGTRLTCNVRRKDCRTRREANTEFCKVCVEC